MKRIAVLLVTVICTTLGLVATPAFATAKPLQTVITSVRAVPGALGSSGGRFEVKGQVKRATWCQLKLLSSHTLPVVYSHNPKKCTSGSYTAHVNVVIGPNSRPG
jgi:hypothetical protein